MKSRVRLMIKIVFFLLIFFENTNVVLGGCSGSIQCYNYDPFGNCLSTIIETLACKGSDKSTCLASGICQFDCSSGASCNWSSCTCSWDTWSDCYVNAGGYCVKERLPCTCNPAGCGTCGGSGYENCTVTCAGNTSANCPTYCDYAGGTLQGSRVGCGCATISCPATAACCTSTNPDTPTLYAPGTGTTIPVNQSVNLDWNGISSWGTGCPQSNKYEVCVMSGSTCDLMNWDDVASNTTIKAWTPAAGDDVVTWKVRSNNGSNTAESLTRTLCVEDQLCTYPQCGEVRRCTTTKCPNTDNGGPAAPTTVSPLGTVAAPAIFPVGSNINFDWSSNSSLTEYYRVLVRDSVNTIVASDLGVSIPATEKTFGPFNTPGLYRWYVDAVNTDCGVTDGPNSEDQYFRINSPPTIVKIQVANSDITPVPNDNTTDNHICKSEFTGTTKPREVVFGIFINDPDGIGDSGSPPVLYWNGQNYPSAWTGTGGGNNAAQVRVDYASYVGAPPQSLHEVTATYSDRWGASVGSTLPVLPTNRLNWKVWNCQVPVSGTLYKAVDAQQICFNGTGFSEPVDVGVSFDSIIFSDSPDVTMTVTKPAYFGTNSIVWGKTYLPLINGGSLLGDIDGDLLADVRKTRIIDLAVGTTTCPSGSSLEIGYTNVSGVHNINPYSAFPRAQIDFSFIRDQEAWYQVVGAGVKSRHDLEYGVPVTAPTATKFLSLGNSTVYNGLVSATSFDNINGNNNNEFGGPIPYENWYLGQNTNDDDIYNYNYFYNNFYVKTGKGEIKNNSWGDWATNQIYFVNENLNINQNLSVPNGETMMVIVSGNIIIDPSVTQLDGIYIADGEISAGGINGSQLVINGMLYAGGDIGLYRSFVVKRTNNTTPAVKVNYSPGLIFNLPPEIMRVLSGWREE